MVNRHFKRILPLKCFIDALRVIRASISDPEGDSERKRAHYTNVATSEVFFESTPCVLIQITLVLTILSSHCIEAGKMEFAEIVNTEDNWHIFVFSISFASSVISSAFGVSRYAINCQCLLLIIEFSKSYDRTLLYGVCRIISPVGPMEGACGGRLLFIFIATLASIIIKGLSMCVVIHFIEEDRYGSELKVIFLMLIFLPQLIMSLISTTGFFNFEFREFFKLISHHPDLILLPLGTTFNKMHF